MKYATLITLAALLVSCGGNSPREITDSKPASAKSTPADQQQLSNNVMYEPAVLSDITGTVAYPLILKKTAEDDDDSYSGRGSTAVYWNIAFYNPTTKQSYLLTNRKMMIMSYDDGSSNGNSDLVVYKHAGSDHPNKKSLRFYRVTCDDFNKNGKLDESDPIYLFVSDIDGKNFKQLSPKSMSVTDWNISVADSKVYLKVTADTDADKAFTGKDRSMPYIADLKTLSMATPVVDSSFNEAAGSEFKRLWAPGKN